MYLNDVSQEHICGLYNVLFISKSKKQQQLDLWPVTPYVY